ncbi:hypothetical protein LCGC14_2512510 [marine sediment metagenome]|uniref:Uncharacterized protein n=1 Tax=marine sediment metagenome TaxID=412755 RepID=A0A0F9BLN4_9ZZZZ
MAAVYESSDGQWIIYNNGIKTYFATQAEAMNMSEKLTFATEVQEFSTAISLLVEKLPTFQKVWADREYLSGAGEKAITDADLESLGITKVQLTAFITPFASELQDFMGNQPVTQADYAATLSALRTDV